MLSLLPSLFGSGVVAGKTRNTPRDFVASKFKCNVEDWEMDAAIAKAQSLTHVLVQDKEEVEKLIGYIDLTTLAGDDTPDRVQKLYTRARAPVAGSRMKCAAVCVYPARVADVRNQRDSQPGPRPKIAAVAGGFPSGQYHLGSRRLEVELAVADGAEEIDIVIARALALQGLWEEVHREVSVLRMACGNARLKTILAVGELGTRSNIYMASQASLYAGSDWIKTSTGKEAKNANLPDSYVMLRAIKDYHKKTGIKVGFKPAGGLKTVQDAMEYVALVRGVLGPEWLCPSLLRLGASSLLDSVIQALQHH